MNALKKSHRQAAGRPLRQLAGMLRQLGCAADTIALIKRGEWEWILTDARAAYKTALVQTHPDRGGCTQDAQRFSELFARIKENLDAKLNPQVVPQRPEKSAIHAEPAVRLNVRTCGRCCQEFEPRPRQKVCDPCKETKHTCRRCSEEFQPRAQEKVCDACKEVERIGPPPLPDKLCPCGLTFTPWRESQNYHDAACRQRFKLARKQRRLEEVTA